MKCTVPYFLYIFLKYKLVFYQLTFYRDPPEKDFQPDQSQRSECVGNTHARMRGWTGSRTLNLFNSKFIMYQEKPYNLPSTSEPHNKVSSFYFVCYVCMLAYNMSNVFIS